MMKTENLLYTGPVPYNPLLSAQGPAPTAMTEKDRILPASEVTQQADFWTSARPFIPITPPREYEQRVRKQNLGEILKNIVDTLQKVRTESTAEQEALLDSKVSEFIEDNKRSTANRIEKMQEQKEVSFWDLFRKIITCIGSALSIVIGGALIATGVATGAGVAMVVAGTLGITSFVLGEVGVHPAVVGGLAIAGAAIGLGTSIFNFAVMSQQLPGLITTISGAIVGIGEGTTQIGVAYHQYRISLLDAKNTDFEQAMSLHKIDIQAELATMEHLVKRFEHTAQTTSSIARDYQQLHKIIGQTYFG